MTPEHVISDELFFEAAREISHGHVWIAYNIVPYFLDTSDMYFFKSHDEAFEFSCNNISEYDDFRVIQADSLQSLLLQIPYENLKATDALNLSNKNLSIMNEKNYDYLKDQLKYTGFGDGLLDALKEKMEKQAPEFQLMHARKFNRDEVSVMLHFRRSAETDMYFFNKYDVNMKLENANEMHQSFYINKSNTITLKEAYNLMNGRSVNKDLTNKEDVKYNAWLQMDFKDTDAAGNFKLKQFHQNYGYDLEASLAKLPIKELGNETGKEALMHSLQKGNRQAVTFVLEGKEQRHFIEANPQFKTITVYDGNMQRVNGQAQKEKEGQTESARQETKKDIKNAPDDEGEGGPAKTKKTKKKNSQSLH